MSLSALMDSGLGSSRSGASQLHTSTSQPNFKPSSWSTMWTDAFRASSFSCVTSSSPVMMEFIAEALPRPIGLIGLDSNPIQTYLRAIEGVFGNSATDLASILRVTRPMIYHYRRGMKPSPENFSRIQCISTLATENPALIEAPVVEHFKEPQPNGKSLFELLSAPILDLPAIRDQLHQVSGDRARRQKLVATLSSLSNGEIGKDIIKQRHAEGKPTYVADTTNPDKIMQVRPDQTRVRGRMVNRKFIPDE